MDFHRVGRQLWVGGAMGAEDWRHLTELGVTVSVNLRADRPDDYGDRPPEAALWVPTREHGMPDVDTMMMVVGFVGAAAREGRRVVVHCRDGMARSPLAAVCYLTTTGMSYEEAMDALRAAGIRVEALASQVAAAHDFIRAWRERRRGKP